jgi:LmeA-like phospholipid-binding
MRRLVIALIVLVGALVAADFGAAALAESAVSRQMRQQIGLADDPSVRINGFPFLTQALSGRYSSIDVDAQRLTVGEFKQVELTAHLEDVTAPLSMLLGSGPRSVQVARAEGTVEVGPNDLERLVPDVTKVRIESVDEKSLQRLVKDGADAELADLDPDMAARIVGTVDLLGAPVEIAVLAVLELAGGKARIAPRDVRLSDGTALPIPVAAQRTILSRFTQRLDAGTLPLNVTPTKFQAENGNLVISGTATGLDLG